MKPNEDDPLIFAGSASRSLGAEIAEYLRLPLGRGEVVRFSEGNLVVRARVCADAIDAAGGDRVVTLDLHAPQVQGFFHIPVDDLYALPVLCEAVEQRAFPNLMVVAPDAGFAKKARKFATRLRVPMAIADKERIDHSEQPEILSI